MSQLATANDTPDEPPFENGQTGYVPPGLLTPHELSEDTYDVHSDRMQRLIESIESDGFRDEHPILVSLDGTIFSGHRRTRGSLELGLAAIPFRAVDIDPYSPEGKKLVLSSNDYRDKTDAEKIKEALAWEDLFAEEAKVREQSGGDPPPNLAEGEPGESREKAAEKVGMGRETFRKGKKVYELAQDGDETASAEWSKLQLEEQSIHGAYKSVKDAQQPDDTDSDTTDTDSSSESATDGQPDTSGQSDPDDTDSDSDASSSESDPDSTHSAQTAQKPVSADSEFEDDNQGSDSNRGSENGQQTGADESLGGSETDGQTPESESNPFTRGGADDGRVAELEAELAQKESRIDELESLIKDFVSAVGREDVDEIRQAADRGKELLTA